MIRTIIRSIMIRTIILGLIIRIIILSIMLRTIIISLMIRIIILIILIRTMILRLMIRIIIYSIRMMVNPLGVNTYNLQVAKAREMFVWFGSFYVIAGMGMLAGFSRYLTSDILNIADHIGNVTPHAY